MEAARNVVWLAGRGVARSCGFSWQVPRALYKAFRRGELAREAFDSRIRGEVAAAQAAHYAEGRIDTAPVERLLQTLEHSSRPGWRHVFMTTNWNTVLDRAVAARGGIVWHLNGSIDDPECALHTEVDGHADGGASLDRSDGFRRLLEAKVCVLAGLSIASDLDRTLIERLAKHKNDASWIIVNEEPADIRRSTRLLRAHLPGRRPIEVPLPFEDWVQAGLPELRSLGVIRGQAAL